MVIDLLIYSPQLSKGLLKKLTNEEINYLQDKFPHQDLRVSAYLYKKTFNTDKKYNTKCYICQKELQKTQIMGLAGQKKEYACCQNKCASILREQTNLEKYGCKNPVQNLEVQEKIKNTCLNRYGVQCSLASEPAKWKSKKTCLNLYGVDNAAKSPEVQEKIKKTNLKRYGVECVFANEEIKLKIKKTLINSLGVDSPAKSPEVQEKIKKTNLKRYGTERSSSTPEFRNKVKLTNLERYGVENPNQSIELRKNHYPYINYEILKQYHDKHITFEERVNLLKSSGMAQMGTLIKYLKANNITYDLYDGNESQLELQIFEFIEQIYDREIRKRIRPKFLNGKELDIFIPELNLAIEANGDYYHSQDFLENTKPKNYHKNKTNLCESKGIRLIHIWEHEWNNNQDYCKYVIKQYLNGKIPDTQIYSGKLPRDYFQVLDFPGRTEKPILEKSGNFDVYKTGYILL